MTTLKFVFDKDKVAAAGTTEDELLAPMREHAAKYGLDEPEYGFFTKDGEDAMCVITMAVPMIVENDPDYINYLEKWPLNVDGDNEDCIDSSVRWLRENHMFKE